MGTGIFLMEGTASPDGRTITLTGQHAAPGGGQMTHRAIWMLDVGRYEHPNLSHVRDSPRWQGNEDDGDHLYEKVKGLIQDECRDMIPQNVTTILETRRGSHVHR